MNNRHDRNLFTGKHNKYEGTDYLLSNIFLALILVFLVLGADTYVEVGAEIIEAFFTYIGVL